VGTLDSGFGKNVSKWCVGGLCVEQKSPIEVQLAQKKAKLTGRLGMETSLEILIDHTFFQRLEILGSYPVTNEGVLGYSEDALRRVVGVPVPPKLVEESP
jgi:hypothetical protein